MQKELEIATAEMERAQHRLVMLEREKEALQQQVVLTCLWTALSVYNPST